MAVPEFSREYREARRALLDALDALAAHRGALILVGAQAVYFRAPLGDTRPTYTTDGDLAVDPDLLAGDPDIVGELERAGFTITESGNPGSWESPSGVDIDLMVPEGVLPQSSRRSARLTGHGSRAARRTRGLEVALYDNSEEEMRALADDDDRAVTLRIAGPAALLVAKLVKIRDRLDAGNEDRILPKDAGDVLRLLRNVDAYELGQRLAELARQHEDVAALIQESVSWLRWQSESRSSSLTELVIRYMAEVEDRAQVALAFGTLAGRVFGGFHST